MTAMKVKQMGNKRNRPAPIIAVDEPNDEATITEPIGTTATLSGTEIEGTIEVELPKPRVSSFVPRPCSMCTALRPQGTNYSRVETTRGNVRYCRCTFCNNTFKQSE